MCLFVNGGGGGGPVTLKLHVLPSGLDLALLHTVFNFSSSICYWSVVYCGLWISVWFLSLFFRTKVTHWELGNSRMPRRERGSTSQICLLRSLAWRLLWVLLGQTQKNVLCTVWGLTHLQNNKKMVSEFNSVLAHFVTFTVITRCFLWPKTQTHLVLNTSLQWPNLSTRCQQRSCFRLTCRRLSPCHGHWTIYGKVTANRLCRGWKFLWLLVHSDRRTNKHVLHNACLCNSKVHARMSK